MKTELELQKEFIENPELKEQLEFIEKGGASGIQGVVLMDAFLKGIRDLGYKNTPYALNEINDNSFQAGARNIHYELIGTSNKIDEMVIYDDGHGMPPKMLTVAVTWGGTHRQGSRKGFGKYGYGLPSASLSIAKKYTIYSKVKGGDWNKIVFDITKLETSEKPSLDEIRSVPEKCDLPKFIKSFEGKNLVADKLESGTIIHYEELDKIYPTTINTLKNNLLFDFGQTYFKLLNTTKMYVDNQEVKPVDPCFASPGMKGYEDEMNNLKVEDDDYHEMTREIEDEEGNTYEVQIRWTKIHPLFAVRNDSDEKDVEQAVIKGKVKRSPDTKSFRWKVMTQNHGLIFRRLGRRMDVVKNIRGGRSFSNNNARYWKCEINFPPVLDEHFAVNTSKQQIIPDERFIKTLEESGIFGHLEKIEREYAEWGHMLRAKMASAATEDPSQKRESEIDAEAANLVMGTTTATPDYQERKEKADKRKQAKIEEIAKKKNITVEQAAKDYEDVYKGRPTKFSEEKLGKHNAFLKFDEHGDTVEVVANMDHSFYKNFYMGPGSNPESRKSWETFFLMFAQLFYKHTEDHQDFINSFVNELSAHLKTVARQRAEKSKNTETSDDDFDDDLPGSQSDASLN
tara:strand:+ start:1838 stop:3715 length:1878 start_codon:yes stop_codon:yes gene_type:complete